MNEEKNKDSKNNNLSNDLNLNSMGGWIFNTDI